jgi:uncharacterized coiled-coil protein SlyX
MAEMTVQEAEAWGRTLDFPTVWAALLKLGERVDQTTKTVDKLGERVDQTTKTVDKLGERVDQVTKTVDKMAERVDRVTANVGGLNLSMGELIETLFAPNLGAKFDAYQYNLKRSFKRVPVYDDANRQRGEIDILLSDTVVCMVVEVKRWLDKTDQIDDHIRRMRLIRQYPPAEVKEKKLLGAIAAAVVTPEVREYAEQNGFFVLELTGEDVRLLEPPKNFVPKEW